MISTLGISYQRFSRAKSRMILKNDHGPLTLAILAAISRRVNYRRGIASSLHGRFEIAAKSRLKSLLKSPQNRQCKRAIRVFTPSVRASIRVFS